MPRAAPPADDPLITVRLRYGVHTIFLFAMLDWTFSRLTSELLSILRDRYPKGLTPSPEQPESMPVPAGDGDVKLAYALPNNSNDLSAGWKNLKARPEEILGKKGLADLCYVAFALLGPDEDEADAEFVVEVPVLEEDEEL